MSSPDQQLAVENTDREIWRGPDEGCGSYYADSLHITQDGRLGINCGGHVIVMPIRKWHELGKERVPDTTAQTATGSK